MIELKKIIKLLNPVDFWGDKESYINTISRLDDQNKKPMNLYWCSEKNINKIQNIKSGTIIIPENISIHKANKNVNYILVSNPRKAFQEVLISFFLEKPAAHKISSNCIIETSHYNKNLLSVGHYSFIGINCKIGNNVRIGNNTTIYKETIIGDNVTIGSNCTIGGIGFGYEKNEKNENVLIPHIGNVKIGNNVEIGNNTCIDKAVLGSTFIAENVKIDNLVHIAHGVSIGKNSMVIANSMIAGSCIIEEDVWIAPSSSIKNGTTVKKNAIIGMGAVIITKVNEKEVFIGNPGKRLIKM